MSNLFKTAIIWLLLLCAPVQGFAAVAMMSHHSGHEMPMHAVTPVMAHADCCVNTSNTHDVAGSCSSCLDGCVSVVFAPPVFMVSAASVYTSEAIPFRSLVFHSFVSATLERPPQASFA
ncbi:MAG: hypothetical protein V4563_12200 [Pseudomonadota bacterium]